MSKKPENRRHAKRRPSQLRLHPAITRRLRSASRAESEEAQQVAIDAFLTLFADWLAARAEYERPHDDGDEADEALDFRVNQLARLITTTSAPTRWAIWQKLEILEHYLLFGGEGTSWTDNREFVMLAGIKADLATFGY